MSAIAIVTKLARRSFDRSAGYARELVLVVIYAAICVVVTVPVLVATGAAIFWLLATLGLEGRIRTAYLLGGVVVVMFEFAMLYRFAMGLGYAMLGATRSRKI